MEMEGARTFVVDRMRWRYKALLWLTGAQSRQKQQQQTNKQTNAEKKPRNTYSQPIVTLCIFIKSGGTIGVKYLCNWAVYFAFFSCFHIHDVLSLQENPEESSSAQFSSAAQYDSATPWTAAQHASLSITKSWSLLKLMSIELVMPSHHLALCRPLLLLPSIFPSIRVFSNWSALRNRWPKY